MDAALALKAIHENTNPLGNKVLTIVITTEYITASMEKINLLYKTFHALCPEGDFTTQTDENIYPNRTNKLLPRYNDILAQKILSFLLDCLMPRL